MKIEYTLFLVLAVTAGCSSEGSRREQTIDSTKLVSRHIALEKAIFDYYLSIEKDVRMDLGVPEAGIVEHVQSLIDEGYVKMPLILVVTEDGPRWEAVNYHTYKEYMRSNDMTVRRLYGTQRNILDSLFMDSIRSNLLEALKGDSPGR